MTLDISIKNLKNRGFERELKFYTSRSSGPGGQSVNKVNSRVELRFDYLNSSILSDAEKLRINAFSNFQILSSGEIHIDAQSERSQLKNKNIAIDKFYVLMNKALFVPVKRKATKPTRASKQRRLDSKKRLSSIKKQRKSLDF